MNLKLNAKKMQQLIQGSTVAQHNPLPEALPGKDLTQYGTSVIRLNVFDVDTYVDDPRTKPNERYAELRASVLALGIEQALYVTKRPGSPRWMMAKGGNTRLRILRDLAQEHIDKKLPGPNKWLEHDFLIHTFSKESSVLSSHLIENLQRADMTFWDTAKGLMRLRSLLTKESGIAYTLKEFAIELKSTGPSTATSALGDYEFALTKLNPLAEQHKQEMSRNDLRNFIRPQFHSISAIWSKFPGRELNGFDNEYAQWLNSYSNLHGVYNCNALIDIVLENAARSLKIEVEELDLMIEAYKRNKEATLDELRLPPALPPSTADDHQVSEGDLDDDDGHNPKGTEASGKAEHERKVDTGLALLARKVSGDFDGGDGQSNQGMRVRSGLLPKQAGEQQNQQPGESLEIDAQQDLDGISMLASAFAQLQASRDQLADVAGVTHLVFDAPGMPLGYFMEIPKKGVQLGSNSDDLAVQAWFILANLSGQLTLDVQTLFDRQDAHGELALIDNGAYSFRQTIDIDTDWIACIENQLGGKELIYANNVLSVLTSQSAIREPVIDLLDKIRLFKLYESDAVKQGAVHD